MVSSLLDMARRSAGKNVASITDIGDLPYDVVAPILRKITNPEQLRLIETNSPGLATAGDTAELWRGFIKRDIQDWQSKMLEPSNPASWWKVYRKLLREDNAKRASDEEALKQALNARKVEKESRSANIIHSVIPQGKKPVVSRGMGTSGPSRPAPFGSQALKNARTGAGAIAVLKRQTAHASQNRHVVNAVPNHELANKRSAISMAPQSMLNEYAKKNAVAKPLGPSPTRQAHPGLIHAQPNARNPVFAPRTKPLSMRDQALTLAIRKENEERKIKEDRLRTLTGGLGGRDHPVSGSSRPTSTSSSPARTNSPMPGVAPVRKRAAHDIFMAPSKKVKR